MPADLSALARSAREAIDVPPLPPAVRAAAHVATPRPQRSHRARIVAASLAGVSLVAVAAAAQVALRPQVVVSPTNGITVSFDSFGGQRHRPFLRPKHPLRPPPPPTAAELRAAVGAMTFPVTLPAGIPGDRSPRSLLRAGTGAMILTYDLPGAWRRDNHLLRIVLADPRDVFDGGATAVKKHTYELKLGSMEGALRWRVGGEDVIVLKSTMTPAETEHLHRAMIAASRRRE